MATKGAIGLSLTMLVQGFHLKLEDMPDVRIKIYEKAMGKIPEPLLEPTVMRSIETRKWFPKVEELLADAEQCRRERIAANPWSPCIECEDSPGWLTVNDQGVERLRPCPCRARHRARLEGLGAVSEPLALPPARREEPTKVGDIAL